MKIQTTDESFIRDTSTGALINSDNSALEQHKLRKREHMKSKAVERDVEQLKETVGRIEALLQELLSK